METHQTALGLIETRGFIPAIEAADAMVKAAKVSLIGKELTGGALVLIMIKGEVGAVKSAIDAGRRAAEKVGEFRWSHIIPRPDMQTNTLTGNKTPDKPSDIIRRVTPDLDNMTVTQLRHLAREITDLPLKGRQISSANKTLLIQTLKQYYKRDASQ